MSACCYDYNAWDYDYDYGKIIQRVKKTDRQGALIMTKKLTHPKIKIDAMLETEEWLIVCFSFDRSPYNKGFNYIAFKLGEQK